MSAPRPRGLWPRLALLAVVGVGLWFWRGGLGLLPFERELVWQLPETQGPVDLQLWHGETLLKRQEHASLFSPEVSWKLTLGRGEYQALAVLGSDAGAKTLRQTVTVGDEPVVRLEPRR